MVELYHSIASMVQSRQEFVKAIKIAWRQKFDTPPPASHSLYQWFDSNGY